MSNYIVAFSKIHYCQTGADSKCSTARIFDFDNLIFLPEKIYRGELRAGLVLDSLPPTTNNENLYFRPEDWLQLPTILTGEEKFIGLVAVYEEDSNFIAFRASGAYRVDWGNGVITNHTPGSTAQNKLQWSDYSNLTLTSRGYRQAIITITPQAGSVLTSLNFGIKHSQSGLSNGTSVNWLDCICSGSNVTSLTFSGSAGCYLLEKFVFVGNNKISSLQSSFINCFSLVSVDINTTNVTNMSNCFFNCYSLQTVPLFNLANVTNMSNCFYNCTSLQTVPLFNLASVTNMSNCFYNCTSLQTVPLFNLANVTNMSGCFYNCYSLQTVPLFNLASVTNMSSCFSSCYSLQTVPLFNLANVTNMSGCFYNCYSLQTVPLFNLANVTDMSSCFYGCISLFSSNISGVKVSNSYQGCKLGASEIIKIFTNLGNAFQSGQQITVTNNWGSSNLQINDLSIAISKGWTVVN